MTDQEQRTDSIKDPRPPSSGSVSFWTELKRRKVIRVAVVYAIVAWLVIQIADTTFPSLSIPEWALSLVTMCVILGFPISVVLAWAFELTPEGIKTTKVAREEHSETASHALVQSKRNWLAYAVGAAVPTLIFSILALFFYIRFDTLLTSNSSLLTSSTDKSIAVLPFTNLSLNQENAFFADGVHETILTNLANLRELRVVSRTSVMQYRDTTKPMKTIGEELSVAHILEGSMQRSGDEFRMTAQLIDARTDEHLWADIFEGKLTNVFAAQSEVALEISKALNAVLSPQEEQLLDRPETTSIEAYELYLKARDIWNYSGNSGLWRSKVPEIVELLDQAVELDPTFTDAWLMNAFVRGRYFVLGLDRSAEFEREAKRAIDIAIRLEPENPEVKLGLGYYHYNFHRNWSQARFYYNQVAERLPNNVNVHYFLGLVNRREGRWAEAIAHWETAHALDPWEAEVSGILEQNYRKLRNWEKSFGVLDTLIASQPEVSLWRLARALTEFLAKGSVDAGVRFFAADKSESFLGELYYEWLYRTGNLKAFEDEGVIDDWERLSFQASLTHSNFSSGEQAIVLIALGEIEKAQAVANSIIQEVELRAETSYEDFVGQMKLGIAYALFGEIEKAQIAVDKAVAIIPESADALQGPQLAKDRASVMAWMGKKDEAVVELARLVKKPATGLNYHELKNSLHYLPLHDHPGFQAILDDPALKLPIAID